jgi:hypothetical protein
MMLTRSAKFLPGGRWFEAALALRPELVRDTYEALVAFVAPGDDGYSVAQGVSAPAPGGVDAGAADALIDAVDVSSPFTPQFSAQVAALLNGVALAVNPGATTGVFASPFANLPFADKAIVLEFMDGNEAYKVLSTALPAFVASYVYLASPGDGGAKAALSPASRHRPS